MEQGRSLVSQKRFKAASSMKAMKASKVDESLQKNT
jgi:hypothetical protein